VSTARPNGRDENLGGTGDIAGQLAFHVLNIATIYLAGCLMVYIAAGLLARIMLGRGLAEAAVFARNATCGNVGPLAIRHLLWTIA
jgi:hypothetical protein